MTLARQFGGHQKNSKLNENSNSFGFACIKLYNLDMREALKNMQGYVVVRVLVGILGLILSVALHELFHILMHLGRIRHIDFFPTPWSVVKIDAVIPPGYDLEGEEMVAYGITLLVIFITTLIIFKIKDSEDKRSSSQILFPGDKEMQKMKPSEMIRLLDIADPAPAPPATSQQKKPKQQQSHRGKL